VSDERVIETVEEKRKESGCRVPRREE